MTDTVTLVCPPGAKDYAVSYGRDEYIPFRADHLDPDSQWLVSMPPVAAAGKLHAGGFSLAKLPIGPLSSGEGVRLVDKHGVHRSAGANGVRYDPDEFGAITVPPEFAGQLVEGHEFVPAPPIEATEDPVAELHAAADAVARSGPEKKKKATATAAERRPEGQEDSYGRRLD